MNCFTARQIEALLDEMGISKDDKSYLYLQTAISLFMERVFKNQHILYKNVAVLHGKKVGTISKSINQTVLQVQQQNSPLGRKIPFYYSRRSMTKPIKSFPFIMAAALFVQRHITDLENPGSRWIRKEQHLLVDCKHHLLSPYAVKRSDIFDEKHNLLLSHFQKGKKSRPKFF